MRVEAEIGYGSVGYDSLTVSGVKFDVSGDADLYTGTVNAFYDFDTGTAITPYIGAGAGVASMESSNIGVAGITFQGDDSTDAMVLGEVGLKYAVTENVSVGIAYRYNHVFDGENDIDDNAAHLFKLSLTYGF